MAKRLFILALLAAGVWWYWTQWRPHHDYTILSGQLEAVVNEVLTAQGGVGDSDVLENIHTQHTRWGLSWVETDRKIQLDPRKITALIDALTQASQKIGCHTLRQEIHGEHALVELGKGPFVMQRLEFIRAASTPQTPEIAFVIDDVAYDFVPLDHFAALGVPLTFAILPRDKHSKAIAEKAVGLKFPVILHLPMEPLDMAHNNPGNAGLYLKMTPEQLHQQFEKDVASVPHIQGINNHMGSAFTENAEKMTMVLRWVKEKNLFFLDSHTSQKSVVSKVAKQVGVPCLVNETFLDNEDSVVAIEKQLDIALHLALRRKRTIAIGHYRRKYLVEALARKIPEFRAHGVTLVTLPSLYTKP